MTFTEADAAEKNDIGAILDELQVKQVLNLQAIDFFRPGPVELVDGFDEGEVRKFPPVSDYLSPLNL